MKEKFQSLQELEEYAVQVCERCKERINGRFYIKDEPDGKIAIVHNKSKNALRLKDANAGIDYATLILQEVKKSIKKGYKNGLRNCSKSRRLTTKTIHSNEKN